MYRVALSAGAAATVAACSLGSSCLTSGIPERAPPGATASIKRPDKSAALGGEPGTPRNVQLAKLDDQAPAGTFEKAKPGILADRDYSHTSLNAEMARDVINAYRKERGLKPLKLNPELTEAAKNHSRDLAKWDRISHFGSDGSNPWDRVKRSGYNARVAAENVGTGQTSFEEVLKGWKESPGHNKNLLLADAEHVGIALVREGKTEFKTFWTLVIGAPL